MQDDNEAGDYISRAKAKLDHWREAKVQQERASRFDKCSASELIEIAETGKNQDGSSLSTGDRTALNGAWQFQFGERLGTRTDPAPSAPLPSLHDHPLFAVPDDQMVRPRDVVRLCGIPRTTLKRWRRAGHFPKAQRLSPHRTHLHVGWPAREIKAWLRAGGAV